MFIPALLSFSFDSALFSLPLHTQDEAEIKKRQTSQFTTPLKGPALEARLAKLPGVVPTYFTNPDKPEKVETIIIEIEQFAIINALVLARIVIKHDKYSGHKLKQNYSWKMERRGFVPFSALEPLVMHLSGCHKERLEKEMKEEEAKKKKQAGEAGEEKAEKKDKKADVSDHMW